MRNFLFAFCLLLFFNSCQNRNTDGAASYTSALTTEVVGRFAPLNDNERFAYALEGAWDADGVFMRNLIMFAVRDNNINDISELFIWESVSDSRGVQFASDFRTVFFVQWRNQRPGEPFADHHAFHSLFMANGATGKIKRLPVRVTDTLRVAKDGRLVAFIDPWLRTATGERTGLWDLERANIFVFDIETESMTQLTWRVSSPITGGWNLVRYGNIFVISGDLEGGYHAAAAELNPSTMELITLWDRTNREMPYPIDRIPSLPSHFFDDVGQLTDDDLRQSFDPNVRLWWR